MTVNQKRRDQLRGLCTPPGCKRRMLMNIDGQEVIDLLDMIDEAFQKKKTAQDNPMKSNTNSKTCQSCKHWSAAQCLEDGAYGICIRIDMKEAFSQQLKDMSDAAYAIAGNSNDEDVPYAYLSTRPTFGCLLHEHGKCDV